MTGEKKLNEEGKSLNEFNQINKSYWKGRITFLSKNLYNSTL